MSNVRGYNHNRCAMIVTTVTVIGGKNQKQYVKQDGEVKLLLGCARCDDDRA